MRRIGVLGGTFDPIHKGHLALARKAYSFFKLDCIYFVPAYKPPLKKTPRSSSYDRCRMVSIAIRSVKYAKLCLYEIRKKRTSYTYETLRYFRRRFGKNAEIFFLAGSDVLKDLKKWKNINEILATSHFVVSNRPRSADLRAPKSVTLLKMKPVDVSATKLREDLVRRRDVLGVVPHNVMKYIKLKDLYRN